ncbi:MAG: DUF2312 domain-containing protein [Alphaproteobacteria bacterium]|nr:DUF2312 domain-containing protein [Alphaproteobacteria bacterium]OJV15117.1 MAG: DUF2312 domain-containing protein [Alphaproteobacteria bacterium 33-17]
MTEVLDTYTVSAEQLKQYVARIQRLEEEKSNIAEDLKELYAEAKGNGYDIKTLKKIIQMLKKDRHKIEEEKMLLETYMDALGL